MYMLKYCAKRISLMLLNFLIIFMICFVLIKLLPINDFAAFGQDGELLKERLKERGYYDPIFTQLIRYVKRIFLEGDFGIGVNLAAYRGRDVWEVFVEKLPPTILLNIYSSLLSVPIGIALGIFAALKKNKWQDHVISTGVMVLISVPAFVYASLILYILCFKWNLLPKTMKPGFDYFSWSMFKSMIPAVQIIQC